jgi:ABC-type glutathione transport system ATPase component
MSRRMWLIRGLSGSGKSTLGRILAGSSYLHEADNYFVGGDGVYRFDPSKLAEAHKKCLYDATINSNHDVFVCNTFTQRWEMEPYLAHARSKGMEVRVIAVSTNLTDEQLAARNVHGVTADVIAAQRSRFEHDWENGNPIAPWLR